MTWVDPLGLCLIKSVSPPYLTRFSSTLPALVVRSSTLPAVWSSTLYRPPFSSTLPVVLSSTPRSSRLLKCRGSSNTEFGWIGPIWIRLTSSYVGPVNEIKDIVVIDPPRGIAPARVEKKESYVPSSGGNKQIGNVIKVPVKVLDIGSYKELKDREVPGDELEHDHIPSFAALKKAKESELGRPLTDEEAKNLYQNATAIEVPKSVHAAGPTYKGRNTQKQIEQDAMDLNAAVNRDVGALRINMSKLSYDQKSVDVDKAVEEIIERNRQTE
ncbi:hypothetical protein [Photorhabdus asymbiotica]|nr:hypothetical protein [Photorhabdus asymbiotica]